MENTPYKTKEIITSEGEILIAFVGIDDKTFDDICARFHKRVGYALLKVDSIERIEEKGYKPEMTLIDESISLDKLPNIQHATITSMPGKNSANAYSVSDEINPTTNNPFIEDTIESIIGQTLLIRQEKLFNNFKDKLANLINKVNEPNEMENAKQELLSLFEAKDKTTHNHTQQVIDLVEPMCIGMERIGMLLSDNDKNVLNTVALIHDIGKITIPDQLIKNDDRFSNTEFAVMKKHIATNILLAVSNHAKELFSLAMKHHYRFEGNGYPEQEITKNEIPLISRMMTVIDSFEAMTSTDRSYQQIMPLENAFEILYTNSQAQTAENKVGGQFDPDCSLAFLTGFKEKLIQDEAFRNKWLKREGIDKNSPNYTTRLTEIVDSLDSTISKFGPKDDTKHM